MFGSNDLMKFITEEKWERAKMQCKSHPNQARAFVNCPGFFDGVRDSSVLPLHQAIRIGAPIDVISAIIHAYEEALRSKESAYQRLPIHIACRTSSDPTVINLLLNHFPAGAQTADNLGRIPLHYAINNGVATEVIRILLRRCPGGVRAADYKGWLPIHVACSAMSSTEVFRSLILAYPESVLLTTQLGHSPKKLVMDSDLPGKDAILEILDEATKSKEARLFKQWSKNFRGKKDKVVPVVQHSAFFT